MDGILEQKRCGKCSKDKPVTEFNFTNKAKGWRASTCRSCQAAYKADWWEKNKVEALKKLHVSNARRKAVAKAFVADYLKTHGCVDCPETDPVVLEFDHVRGKKLHDVAKLVSHGYRIETIQAEIDKCEVRCANCHKRRHNKGRRI